MLKFLRDKKNKILVSWIFSYLAVFILPLIINTSIYLHSINAVEDQIKSGYTNTLNQISLKTDKIISEINQSYSKVAFDDRTITLMNMSRDQQPDWSYLCMQLLSNPVYVRSNEFNGFTYYKKSRVILSSTTMLYDDFYFNINDTKEKLITSEVMSKLDNVTEKTCVNISNNISVLAFPIYDANSSIVIGVYAAYLSDSYVTEVKNLLGEYKETEFTIDAYDTNLIRINSVGIVPTTQNLNKKGDIAFTLQSDNSSLSYNLVSPKNIYYKDFSSILLTIFIYIILSILCGLLIIFLSLKKNYQPIDDIINLVSQNSSSDHRLDGYDMIKDAFRSNITEIKSLKNELSNANSIVYEMNIKNLLLGKVSPLDWEDFVEKFNIKFNSDNFNVMIINIDSFDEIDADFEGIDIENSDARYVVSYAVKNIIKETVSANSNIFIADSDDKIICIINTDDNPLTIARTIQDNVRHYLNTTLSIAISSTHKDYSNISLCYLEASTVFERLIMMSQGEIYEYSQIPQNYSEYIFSTDKELALINSIKSGSYDEADALINYIFEQNITNTSLYKCIIFDITGAILKAIDVIYKVYDDKGFNPNNAYLLDDISSCNSIAETKEKILNVIKIFCDIVNQHKNTKNTKLKSEIIDLIDRTYTNGDLSIQYIADNLNRNPSYISRYFKEQMGMNLLEYINIKRVEYAKELLIQNLKISDVAEKSGFQNPASFIRVFKKVTGTTPGKYKSTE